MKNNHLFAILALIGAVSFISCDKNEDFPGEGPDGGKIWDIGPVVYQLKVVDAEGNDMLDPTKEGSIDYKEIEVVYRDETYRITSEPEVRTSTKAYKPHFEGLKLIHHSYWQCYVLTFGELEGAGSYENEELLINWGDGTSDVLSFRRDFEWGKDGEPEIEHQWFLNGRKYDENIFELLKERAAENPEPPVEESGPIVDWPEETRVGAEGGKFYIPIITDKEYSYSKLNGHFHVLFDECTESVMAIQIYANYDYEEQTARLVFKSGTYKQYVTFIQDPRDHIYIPGWAPDFDKLLFDDTAWTEELVVIANVDYEYGVIDGNDWLSIRESSKDGNQSTFSVSVTDNTGEGRTGQIRFWSENLELLVYVVQNPVSADIEFEDPVVKSVCVANWDTDGDGELSYKEAFAVENIHSEFKGNTEITRFNEFKYFSGIRDLYNTFNGCTSLTAVEIPESAMFLGGTFNGCTSLSDVKLTDNVRDLGCSFYNCKSLREIDLPENLTELDDEVFRGCTALESLEIPESVSKIGFHAFDGCAMKELIIPAAVTEIGENAFINSKIEKIVLPEGLEYLEGGLFGFCTELKEIKIPSAVKRIGEYCFMGCESLESIEIPESLTAVPYRAFQLCGSLKSVTLPASLTGIGDQAFSRTNITEGVVCHAVTPPAIAQDSFDEVSAIYVPDESVDAYKTAEHWSSFSERILPLSALEN